MSQESEVKVIEFEDNGQDFLVWEIALMGDNFGEVINCEPFQSSIWCGQIVLNYDKLEEGGQVVISKSPDDPIYSINHRIERITLKEGGEQ